MNRYTINNPPDINLYDGNISSWTNKYNRQIYSEVDSMEHLLDHHQVNYKYDLAGRLTESVIDTFNFSNRYSQNKYKTEYEYDLNGNMDIVSRTNENGFLTTNTNTFQMAPIAVKQTNRLMTTANLPNPGTSYLYDNMGNLTYENTLPTGSPDDVKQIHWTADGKIEITSKTISVTDSITHAQHYLNMFQHYYYDGMGNRVLKIGNGKLNPNSPEVDPILLHCNEHLGGTSCKDCQKDLNMRAYYYAREAGGKVLATYETTPAGIVALTHGCYAAYYFLDLEEWYIYGSESDGRISTLKPYPNEFTDHLQVNAIHFADQAEPYAMKDTLLYYGPTIIGSYQSNARLTGYREYEIKDHLGNVRAVISDIKNPMEINLPINDWTFKADIRNLSNYYPYGMQLPKGTYSATDDYSYGYNGMEKDDELRESLYSTLFREGDTENGRWWSRDPLEMSMPYQSPYTMMDANPIRYTDVLGNSTEIEKNENKKEKTEEYTFKLKGAILNTSDVPIDINKFKDNYTKSLKETSNGSEEVDGVEVSWTATSVELRVIYNLNELKPDEHLIEITDDKVADGNAYASANGFNGMFIEFTVEGALQMVDGVDIRRGAHEWFHTVGLYHPEVHKISLHWFGEDNITPPNQQILDSEYPQNVMRQTWKWKEISTLQEKDGLGMEINANQVRIMFNNYKNGKINKNNKPNKLLHRISKFFGLDSRYFK